MAHSQSAKQSDLWETLIDSLQREHNPTDAAVTRAVVDFELRKMGKKASEGLTAKGIEQLYIKMEDTRRRATETFKAKFNHQE